MSFILDALRKSEQERQRSENPGIAQVRMQPRQGYKTIWVVLVAALVIVNLLLLAFILLRATPEPTVATPSPNGPAMAETAQSDPPASRSSRPPISPSASTATGRQSRELRDELARQPQKTQKTTSGDIATEPAAATTATKSANSPKQISQVSTLPTFTELTLAGSISLPPLHLDIHVYSEAPAERFIFVNMKKYREGDQLSEGPTINNITDEGVVLRYQGREFLLTRQ